MDPASTPRRAAAVRDAAPAGADAIASLAVAAQLFAEEDAHVVRDMLRSYFDGDAEAGHRCAVVEHEGVLAGVAYWQPRGIADRVWDLTMIAVRPELQGRGYGGDLLRSAEDELREHGQRLLLVETSGTAAFDGARAFYRRSGYAEAARIPGYWEDGDDLVLFTKDLRRSSPANAGARPRPEPA